jgi:hypothetical protein
VIQFRGGGLVALWWRCSALSAVDVGGEVVAAFSCCFARAVPAGSALDVCCPAFVFRLLLRPRRPLVLFESVLCVLLVC